ncbi:hypothetical protein CLOM_g17895, partial [Closterium sp. NIES-68]
LRSYLLRSSRSRINSSPFTSSGDHLLSNNNSNSNSNSNSNISNNSNNSSIHSNSSNSNNSNNLNNTALFFNRQIYLPARRSRLLYLSTD